MSGLNERPHSEVVIVRRGHGHDGDGHHGGVWKIAYADFMTAMMAFFLVMWLINAANEETRSQVASYFNPVKLTDSVTSDKGLNQPKNKPKKGNEDSPDQSKKDEHSEKEFDNKKGESEVKRLSEEKLFKDPYVVLAQLAGEAAQGSPAGDAASGAATTDGGNSGLKDGEAYRDPFDPQSWQSLPHLDPQTGKEKPETKTAEAKLPAPSKALEPDEKVAVETQPSETKAPKDAHKQAGQKEEPKPRDDKVTAQPEHRADEKTPERIATPRPDEKIPEKIATPKPDPIQAEAAALMKSIGESLGQYGSGPKPNIAVEASDEGLLISLTDNVEFGMFTIGSAEPKAKVVAIMEKIATVIKDKPGKIVLRGHTDGRPYRSELYDNWRLSSARAQMAYYMLTRAGIDPLRIERIEGHADRKLKRPDDPNAAENRRIEILLRAGTS